MRVFVSAVGQHDNVGDTVLRRPYLDALRSVGRLHVWIGAQTDDQLGGLGLRDGDVAVRSSTAWRRDLASSAGREPFLYGFDTGETELRRPFAARYARLAPLLAANRLRGGCAVHVGVGVRAGTRWRYPIRAALRVADLVTWRDRPSRRIMGLGEVVPDWAFATGAPARRLVVAGDRPLLAIAMRASLPHAPRTEPDDAWADRAGDLARTNGLTPVFTAQIGRDGPLAERLAARAGAEAVVWTDGDHAGMEARLRAVYRRSAAVLSDRLHGLVMGATEGAVPVVLADDPADKSVRTLDGAGIRGTGLDPALHRTAALPDLIQRRDEVVEAVLAARLRLDVLSTRIRGAAA